MQITYKLALLGNVFQKMLELTRHRFDALDDKSIQKISNLWAKSIFLPFNVKNSSKHDSGIVVLKRLNFQKLLNISGFLPNLTIY